MMDRNCLPDGARVMAMLRHQSMKARIIEEIASRNVGKGNYRKKLLEGREEMKGKRVSNLGNDQTIEFPAIYMTTFLRLPREPPPRFRLLSSFGIG